jgi:SAM-dependent methyltransferase
VVDYSQTSIELAKSCFRDEADEIKSRVRFILGDVANLTFSGSFKLAVAGDLIEHLNKEEVSHLVETLAHRLKDDGVFLIHTFPNRWYYKKHYPRLQRAAEKIGAFLPAEPRSRYELLMHINEQSPAVLRRTLRRAFRHVVVWVDTPDAPGENLLRKCSINDVIKAPDVYVLASQSPLDLRRAKRLLMQPRLSPSSVREIHLSITRSPEKVIIGSRFTVWVKVVNNSLELLSSFPPHPINVSYHWFRYGVAEATIFEGVRTNLSYPLAPTKTCTIRASVTAPPSAGRYRLQMCLVQEGCSWFYSTEGPTSASTDIFVI